MKTSFERLQENYKFLKTTQVTQPDRTKAREHLKFIASGQIDNHHHTEQELDTLTKLAFPNVDWNQIPGRSVCEKLKAYFVTADKHKDLLNCSDTNRYTLQQEQQDPLKKVADKKPFQFVPRQDDTCKKLQAELTQCKEESKKLEQEVAKLNTDLQTYKTVCRKLEEQTTNMNFELMELRSLRDKIKSLICGKDP